MSGMRHELCPVIGIDRIWPLVREGLEKSLMEVGGDMSVGELYQGCRRGDCLLLLVIDDEQIIAASVWKPETWATGHKLRCLGLYGTGMDEWIMDMREAAREVAKRCGATSLLSEGREGWGAVFPNARKLRSLYEEAI